MEPIRIVRTSNVLCRLTVLLAPLFVLATACAPMQVPGHKEALSDTVSPGVTLPTKPCADLANVDLTAIGGAGSRVTRAREGVMDGVPVCEVEGTLAPEIGFKTVLPTKTWTGRFVQAGCGGLCGRISLNVGPAEGCQEVKDGRLAIASTNMGHEGMGGDFGQDPQKRIDFAYRGVHLTTLASKSLITEFYGKPPSYSYFLGCSDGGREALMEAQRYPDDFDGIVAGAPALNFQVQNSFYHAWQARANSGAGGKPILTADRLPVLHKAVVAACDKIDGLEDGLISDPRACSFDPATVVCSTGQKQETCLTPAEAEAARKLYAGPKEVVSGASLTLGGPQFGSELSWEGVFVPRPGSDRIFSRMIAEDSLRNLIFEKNPAPGFSIEDLRFDANTFAQVSRLQGLYGATDPDLAAFEKSGGKLILWHGWSDPHISPINTIAYFEAVERTLGRDRVDGFLKLFVFPGVYHCSGGDGPDTFDLLTPIMAWVEQGKAPQQVLAVDTGRPDLPPGPPPPDGRRGPPPGGAPGMERPPVPSSTKTRPVFAYPNIAAYSGSGPVGEASSFVSKAGRRGPDKYEWMGADLFAPSQRLDCEASGTGLACVAASEKSVQ